MAKPATVLIKLVSTAGTGLLLHDQEEPPEDHREAGLRKYDPKARKHVEFKEAKIK